MTVGSGCISLFCFPQLSWFLWIMKFRNETFDTYDSMNFWYDVSLALIFPFGWLNYHPRLKSNPRVLKFNELLEQNRFVSRYSFISSRSHYITRRKHIFFKCIRICHLEVKDCTAINYLVICDPPCSLRSLGALLDTFGFISTTGLKLV